MKDLKKQAFCFLIEFNALHGSNFLIFPTFIENFAPKTVVKHFPYTGNP